MGMIRRLKPTRIELKKTDLEEFEQKMRENNPESSTTSRPSLDGGRQDSPMDFDAIQEAIKKRIGYEPQTVPSDGASNINY